MPDNDAAPHFDVAVVGAGQAGLAIGYLLTRQGRRFVILDGADSVGAAWRNRWDSLVLFTPRRYDSLPGLPFPGDPDGYPTRDEVAAYLESYAEAFALPVELGSAVESLAKEGDTFVLGRDDRTIEADQVVVATGPFQCPRVPELAIELAPEAFQIHSADYRTSTEVPQGTVLVVGGGNTGYQIAEELASSHEVHLSIGARQTPLPQRVLGRDLFWYLEATGLIGKTTASRIGRRMAGRDTLIGSRRGTLRRRHGVEFHGRAVEAAGTTVSFNDGTSVAVRGVIWATGFGVDNGWIHIPALYEEGRLVHQRGVTRAPGLYFLGLSWQHTRGSALLGWVKDDAEYIAHQIAAFGTNTPAETRAPAPARRPLAQR
jgi:putative flavoprotein involved in K+ transport